MAPVHATVPQPITQAAPSKQATCEHRPLNNVPTGQTRLPRKPAPAWHAQCEPGLGVGWSIDHSPMTLAPASMYTCWVHTGTGSRRFPLGDQPQALYVKTDAHTSTASGLMGVTANGHNTVHGDAEAGGCLTLLRQSFLLMSTRGPTTQSTSVESYSPCACLPPPSTCSTHTPQQVLSYSCFPHPAVATTSVAPPCHSAHPTSVVPLRSASIMFVP